MYNLTATINGVPLPLGVLTTVPDGKGGFTGTIAAGGLSIAIAAPAVAVVAPPPPPLVLSGTLPGGTVGAAYSAALAVEGGTAPTVWAIVGLPPGLTASGGVITGVPTTAGPYTVAASVSDASKPIQNAAATFNVTIAAAVAPPPPGAAPTNAQLILQGQNGPVATQNLNNTVVSKGGTTAVESSWNYLGFKSANADSYNVYRSANGGPYVNIGNISAADAAANYAKYLALFPAQTPTYGNYIQTQCSPASGIDCAYFDTTATGTMQPAAGIAFAATGNIVAGSPSVTITAASSGTLMVGQGIGAVSGLPIGSTIVSQQSGAAGGPGTYTMSQPALATLTGVAIGSVLFGNQAYTYYLTGVKGGVESAPSDFAYIPFITNGGLVMCNGAFDSCVATLQAAPAVTPLGYSQAACWFPIQPTAGGKCSGYPSYLNAFSGNSAGNFNLNVAGYKFLKLSVCPSTAGLGPAGGNSEICGDVGLVNMTGAQMAAYGPASWAQNEWSTYKIPLEAIYTDAVTGVLQNAFYKDTWGVGGTIPPNTAVFVEYIFTVD